MSQKLRPPGEEERQAQHVEPAGAPVAEQQARRPGTSRRCAGRSLDKQRQRGRLRRPAAVGGDVHTREDARRERAPPAMRGVLPRRAARRSHRRTAPRSFATGGGRSRLNPPGSESTRPHWAEAASAAPGERHVVPFQQPTGLADGLGLESAPGSSWIPRPRSRGFRPSTLGSPAPRLIRTRPRRSHTSPITLKRPRRGVKSGLLPSTQLPVS